MSIGSKKSAALSYMAPPKTDDATRLESYIPLYRVWEGFCANLPLVLGFFVRSGLVALALRFRSKRENRAPGPPPRAPARPTPPRSGARARGDGRVRPPRGPPTARRRRAGRRRRGVRALAAESESE